MEKEEEEKEEKELDIYTHKKDIPLLHPEKEEEEENI